MRLQEEEAAAVRRGVEDEADHDAPEREGNWLTQFSQAFSLAASELVVSEDIAEVSEDAGEDAGKGEVTEVDYTEEEEDWEREALDAAEAEVRAQRSLWEAAEKQREADKMLLLGGGETSRNEAGGRVERALFCRCTVLLSQVGAGHRELQAFEGTRSLDPDP